MDTTRQKNSERRLELAEIFSGISPETFKSVHLFDLYPDFWKLADEAQRMKNFSDEEKNFVQKIFSQVRQENDPLRRQYLALALIMFGHLQDVQQLIDFDLWPPQLKEDFVLFLNWNELVNNPLSPMARATIARNEKISAFLQEKYSALIQNYSQATLDDCPRVRPQDYQIYFCWLQGEDNLPPLIRCCYNSLKQNAGRYKIIFIDEKNFSQYVDIAPHIMKKFRDGKISRTHFSDILRVNLLEQHGGLWLDATILVTEPLENHEDFWQMPYFTQKYYHDKNPLNPFVKSFGCYISYARWAGFIQGSSLKNNPFFTFEKEFFNEYWRDFDSPIIYDFMDIITDFAYENIPCVRKEFDAVPINNDEVWMLVEHLNDAYADYPFDKILPGNFLHKLNCKITLDMTRNDTVFREIQRRYAPETIQK